MLISHPAPALCQGSDEDLLVAIGAVIFPGFLERPKNENGLRLWVAGDPSNPSSGALAAAEFQTLLGVLRAWRADAGELREEQLSGLGQGSVRDEAGNQWVKVGAAVAYAIPAGEVESFATDARAGIESSQALRNALWLNGRSGRTGADYYMIHEYAELEFGGSKGVRNALGVSDKAQVRLAASANNLSPLEGGRHAKDQGPAPWSLERQREFLADLLRRWIRQGSVQGKFSTSLTSNGQRQPPT